MTAETAGTPCACGHELRATEARATDGPEAKAAGFPLLHYRLKVERVRATLRLPPVPCYTVTCGLCRMEYRACLKPSPRGSPSAPRAVAPSADSEA